MKKFDSILRKIKKLEVQGAEHVAYAALDALKDSITCSKKLTKTQFLKELNLHKHKLFTARPTEPCMRNAIHYVVEHNVKDDLSHMKANMLLKIEKAEKHFLDAEKRIALIGARLVKKGSRVFTHCHSSTVMNILKKAKDSGKDFDVLNTETRPNYQGRITARELSSYGIHVTHFVDAAARLAIKKSDLVLMGCDAITTTKVINKIGSEMYAEVAHKHDVPVYTCTDSWKFDAHSIFGFDEHIESRNKKEVWDSSPKKVTVSNLIFEKVDFDVINGIVSEVGLYTPDIFVEEVKRTYPYLYH